MRTVENTSRDSADLNDLEVGDKLSIDRIGYDVMGPARDGYVPVRPHGCWSAPVTIAALAEVGGVVSRMVQLEGHTCSVSTDWRFGR